MTIVKETEQLDEIDEEYEIKADGVKAKVSIGDQRGEYVKQYRLQRAQLKPGTQEYIQQVRNHVIETVEFSRDELTDSDQLEKVKQKYKDKVREEIEENFPKLDEQQTKVIVGTLIHEMVGLGDIEYLLSDPNLEELVVNSSDEPAWVYHRGHGWVKSNIMFQDEEEIANYSSDIARKVGKNISSLDPLLDAQLPTGDRTNATLQPISSQGNTITIRKFARDPWTITDFIENGTISKEVAAFLWLCIQYELSILVSGGTGSGKTSLLNVLMPFVPPDQRVLSIEDTREVQLPDFLHWVPTTTREPNPEGKGEVSMLDLLVNALRMRPDRILVGEIRKKRQAEVLFEAMHTGHSVYATLHADTAQQTVDRLINPPIDVPEQMVESLDVNVVQFRDRRRNFRRVFQVAEIGKSGYKRGGEGTQLSANEIYKWESEEDEHVKQRDSQKIYEKLNMHTGMDRGEMQENIRGKEQVLQWMLDNQINSMDPVGKIIAEYYNNKEDVLELAKNNGDPQEILKRYEDK